MRCIYMNVFWNYLHPFFTAAEQASVGELKCFLGSGTLLPFIFQTPKVTFIDCERLKGLFWTQVALETQILS